ncbi:hypothetical protein [Siphonobacter sp. SORGH_AS_0500]|uniref:hypothetical protein n=1 Tax=Siphonobacter sp. SORGH_AS_0500 TaxID=1864824 RepID=UPI001E3537AF|nr:hypothetical protein [Siphonobacter sp. SORGH_AS_0500]
MNRPLRYLIPILLCISLITSCKKKYEKASERTDEALKQELNEEEVRAKLVEYAQKKGIETETFTDPEASGFALLSEIGFGHKPKYMKYVEKVQPIDSAAVRMAGWSIVQGVDVADAMKQLEPNYPAYDRLKQEYTRLLTENKSDSAQWVAESLNAYRWIHRQAKKSSRLVLVNIRGAYLVGMDSSGKVDLKMRVVAGKKDKATPGMDT